MTDTSSNDASADEAGDMFVQADAFGGQLIRAITDTGMTLCVSLDVTVGGQTLRFLMPASELPMVDQVITGLGADAATYLRGDDPSGDVGDLIVG